MISLLLPGYVQVNNKTVGGFNFSVTPSTHAHIPTALRRGTTGLRRPMRGGFAGLGTASTSTTTRGKSLPSTASSTVPTVSHHGRGSTWLRGSGTALRGGASRGGTSSAYSAYSSILLATRGGSASVTRGGSASVTRGGSASVTRGGSPSVTRGGSPSVTRGATRSRAALRRGGGVTASTNRIVNSVVRTTFGTADESAVSLSSGADSSNSSLSSSIRDATDEDSSDTSSFLSVLRRYLVSHVSPRTVRGDTTSAVTPSVGTVRPSPTSGMDDSRASSVSGVNDSTSSANSSSISSVVREKKMQETDIIVSCPLCMEKYSVVRYPVVSPNCGHSLCTFCAIQHKRSVCVTCGKSTTTNTNGNDMKKNFALLDLITMHTSVLREKENELMREKEMNEKLKEENKKKQDGVAPNDIDYMECSKCQTKEKRERMKICGTCADKWNKEWKGMKEEETADTVDTETRKSCEKALGCPICFESYSLTRYPVVAPECGHSICVECGKERNSNICVTCNTPSYFCNKQGGIYIKGDLSSRLWKKNFDLCALLELSAQDRNVNDLMNCTNCKSKEKRERMKICVTCAEKWNKEWKGMKEEEILPFILCLFCCHEKEGHRGHALANYLPWKLNELISTTVSNNQATVSSMDELSHFEMERGKACVKMWKKEMDSFRSIDSMKCETYREGLSIVDVLNKECELITRASEECLHPLRKYSKIVKDSTARIHLLKTDAREYTGELVEDV